MTRKRKDRAGALAHPDPEQAADPKVWRRYLAPHITQPTTQNLAYVKARIVRDISFEKLKRKIMDLYHTHRYCPARVCRRARRCSGPNAVCFDEAEPLLRRYVFPKLRELRKQFAPEEEVQPHETADRF